MISASIRRELVSAEYNLCKCLAHQCMPTLLKVKPASLLLIDKSLFPDLQVFYSLLMKYLKLYSCSLITFQETDARLYLFLYREELLYPSITMGLRQNFLESYGYSVKKEQLASVLGLLGRRYRNYWITGEFPHEIGIFLGYPLTDVEAFIRNQGRNYLLCGMWKVYSRVQIAEMAFASFHRLRDRSIKLVEAKSKLFSLCNEEMEQYQRLLWELLTY
ncbi:MAG: hypothetical protein K0R34_4207 [Herbinix sp.]|nr:hypothetical protein [Herbinix sp.]